MLSASHKIARAERFGSVEPLGPWRARAAARLLGRTPVVAMIATSIVGVIAAKLVLTHHPRVALALFGVVVAGVLVLLEPGIGVLAYYVLAFMRPHETLWGLGNTRFTLLLSVFTLGATALHFALRPNLGFLWRKQTIFVCLLWLFLHLSSQRHEIGPDQVRWLDYYNKMFLIYFVTLALLNSERWLWWLAWVIAVSIGYLAIWANQMYFIEGWATVHGPGKRGATYFDENDFAMILGAVVPFCWYLIGASKHLAVRAAVLGLLVLAAHGVMVTFSRGGFLGLAVSTTVLLLRMKRRGLAVLIACAAIAGFISVTGPRYAARMLTITNYEEDKSATGRLDSWRTGGRMMAANPIFGVGFKRYVAEYPNYGKTHAREAHNSWVQLGAECGLIAVSSHLALVALTIAALVRVRRRLPLLPEESRRKSEALAGMYEASLIGYLVTGFFLSMEDFEFFYLLVAMAQILDRVTEERVLAREAAGESAAGPVSA